MYTTSECVFPGHHLSNVSGGLLAQATARRAVLGYTFHEYRLAGRSTVRVHTGQGRDTRIDVYQDRRNHVWDNRSDTATLRNDHDRLIDDEPWGRNLAVPP
jgi:hypothetical protein